MKETPLAALTRIGTSPLKRLAWAVDFSQRALLPQGISDAELELTCFVFAEHLIPDRPGQIHALMTNPAWKEMRYGEKEFAEAQRRFLQVLRAAAGDGKAELPLKNVAVHFTRAEGLEYVSTIPGWRFVGQPITTEQRTKAKLEIAVFKLLRLLDQTVRADSGKRFIPLRLYTGICPESEDGCGKLFAKARIDQDYCSRTCVSRAQVRRFRRNRATNKPEESTKTLAVIDPLP